MHVSSHITTLLRDTIYTLPIYRTHTLQSNANHPSTTQGPTTVVVFMQRIRSTSCPASLPPPAGWARKRRSWAVGSNARMRFPWLLATPYLQHGRGRYLLHFLNSRCTVQWRTLLLLMVWMHLVYASARGRSLQTRSEQSNSESWHGKLATYCGRDGKRLRIPESVKRRCRRPLGTDAQGQVIG